MAVRRLVEVLEAELDSEAVAMAKKLMKTYGLDSLDELVKKLEDLFEVECLAVIDYDPRLAGVFNEGILPVTEWPKSRFSMAIHRIAEHIMGELPKPKKEDIVEFVRSFVRYVR